MVLHSSRRRISRSIRNLIIAPRRDHSRKPNEVRERIEGLCGELPRIELFARERTRQPHRSVAIREVPLVHFVNLPQVLTQRSLYA